MIDKIGVKVNIIIYSNIINKYIFDDIKYTVLIYFFNILVSYLILLKLFYL